MSTATASAGAGAASNAESSFAESEKFNAKLWTTAQELLLIECLRENTILWCRKNPYYFANHLKHQAAVQLGKKFGRPAEEIKRKIKIFKNCLWKEAKEKFPKWKHYNRLKFMLQDDVEETVPPENYTHLANYLTDAMDQDLKGEAEVAENGISVNSDLASESTEEDIELSGTGDEQLLYGRVTHQPGGVGGGSAIESIVEENKNGVKHSTPTPSIIVNHHRKRKYPSPQPQMGGEYVDSASFHGRDESQIFGDLIAAKLRQIADPKELMQLQIKILQTLNES